jgi:DNA-binding transcriptional LysR family regulator
METRQLAYFLLACQQHNHAAAAQELGVAASTISENIARLEQELGLELFRLAPHGHYPTAEARALYQEFEHVLRLIEQAPDFLLRSRSERLKMLHIGSPLRFALGRISKAATLAARALRGKFPDVAFDIRFAAHDEPASDPAADHCDLVVEYQGPNHKDSIAVCNDPWLLVSNVSRPATSGIATDEILRKVTLTVPDLSPSLIEAAARLCRNAGLVAPVLTDEDIGALPRMSTSDDAFHLLVPRSIFSARLKHFRLHVMMMPPEWRSAIVATPRSRHPALAAFAHKLHSMLAGQERNNMYRPELTLRQIRYFLSVHEHGNATVSARKLGVAQPALSNQLRSVERISGCALFTRHRSGLAPTVQGDRLAHLLRDVEARLNRAELTASRLTTSRKHRMTIGVVPLAERGGVLVQSLVGAIAEWRHLHGDVELRVHEAPTDTLHKWVLSGAANFALVETIVPHSARLNLKSQDPLGVVTVAGSSLLPSGDVRLAELAKLSIILPSRLFGLRQLIDEAAARAGIRLVPRAEVNSLVMALALVADRTMATVMPLGTVRRAVADGELQFNKIVEPEIWRRLSIIYSAERSLSEIERAFIQTLRRHLSEPG